MRRREKVTGSAGKEESWKYKCGLRGLSSTREAEPPDPSAELACG